eukprot:g78976.t1
MQFVDMFDLNSDDLPAVERFEPNIASNLQHRTKIFSSLLYPSLLIACTLWHRSYLNLYPQSHLGKVMHSREIRCHHHLSKPLRASDKRCRRHLSPRLSLLDYGECQRESVKQVLKMSEAKVVLEPGETLVKEAQVLLKKKSKPAGRLSLTSKQVWFVSGKQVLRFARPASPTACIMKTGPGEPALIFKALIKGETRDVVFFFPNPTALQEFHQAWLSSCPAAPAGPAASLPAVTPPVKPEPAAAKSQPEVKKMETTGVPVKAEPVVKKDKENKDKGKKDTPPPDVSKLLSKDEVLQCQFPVVLKNKARPAGTLCLTNKRVIFVAGTQRLELMRANCSLAKAQVGDEHRLKIESTTGKKCIFVFKDGPSGTAADNIVEYYNMWQEYYNMWQGKAIGTIHRPERPASPTPDSAASSATDKPQAKLPILSLQVQREIQAKAALRAKVTEIAEQYDALVAKGVVEEDEFWERHRSKLDAEINNKNNQPNGLEGPAPDPSVASGIIANQAKDEQPGRTVSIRLTKSDQHAIFLEHPVVYRAYQALVPLRMSESEFWRKYFLRQHFESIGRKTEQAKMHVADMDSQETIDFSTFRMKRTGFMQNEKISLPVDHDVDLTATDWNTDGLEDYYQASAEVHARKIPVDPHQKQKERLIERFNRHGSLLLFSLGKGKAADAMRAKKGTAAGESLLIQYNLPLDKPGELPYQPLKLTTKTHEAAAVPSQQQQQWEAARRSCLSDLSQFAARDVNSLQQRWIKSFSPAGAGASLPSYHSANNVVAKVVREAREMRDAVQRGGSLSSIGFDPKNKEHQVIEKNFKAKWRKIHELLWHFWACFAPDGKLHNKAKMERVYVELGHCYTELERWSKELSSHKKNVHLAPLLRPLMDSINKMEDCYSSMAATAGSVPAASGTTQTSAANTKLSVAATHKRPHAAMGTGGVQPAAQRQKIG